MSSTKIIAVVGATGNQGLSVAKAFASDSAWKVRCLTRNPSSSNAIDLANLGCEVIQADLADPDSLAAAFKDVHAVFVNTDFWIPYRAEITKGTDHESAAKLAFDLEVSHGKNAANAANNVPTLERFIYSPLGPMARASNGKYTHSRHWETKAAIRDYIESIPLAAKTSYIYIGAYSTNPFLTPLKGQDGSYLCMMPTTKDTMIPIIDVPTSTGPFVRSLIDEAPHTSLLAYDENLSISQIVDCWSTVTGQSAQIIESTPEAMAQATGRPLEILEAPAYLKEFGYCAGVPNVIEPHELRTKVHTNSFEHTLRQRDLADLLGSTGPSTS